MSTHTHSDTKADPAIDAEINRRMLWMAPSISLITILLGYIMWKNPKHYTPEQVGSIVDQIVGFFMGF